jgi:thiosulfate/3-mercaptopyruvate sulfurtransferase
VDARPPAFYDGVREGQNGKKGHIRGAGNVPYDGVAGEDGVFLSADELRAMFEKAGVKPGDTVVGYCFIGQYATAMLFAARTLGYDVRLYDGSFEDWARRDLPVEETPAKQDRP